MPPQCQQPGGVHELGSNRHGYRVCKHCYVSAQTITSGTRAPCAGDWRVVCHDVCPIGPSDPIPETLKEYALEVYNDHQIRAVELDGAPHDCEVIQL